MEKYFKNHIISLAFKSIFIISVIFLFYKILNNLYELDIIIKDGWSFADWLINYEDGGFKRRGISGSLLFYFQDHFYLPIDWGVFIFQVFFYLSFFYFLVRIMLKKHLNIMILALFYTPLCFLFYYNDFAISGRKEIILLAIFTYAQYQLIQKSLHKILNIILYILIFTATLFHELIIFFIPFFILQYYLHKGKWLSVHTILIYLSALIPILFILFLSKSINEGYSIEILRNRGIVIQDNNIFQWNEKANPLLIVQSNASDYMLYFLSFLINFIMFTIYAFYYCQIIFRQLFLAMLMVLLSTIPLYLLAIDWGRWLNISFILFYIIFLSLLPRNRQNIILTGIKKKTAIWISIIIIVVSLLYKVQHCQFGFILQI